MSVANDINNLLRHSDLGLADVFMSRVKNHFVITDSSGSGYIWNESTRLWEPFDAIVIRNLVPRVLECTIKDHLAHDPPVRLRSALAQLHKRVTRTNFCRGVFEQVITLA